MARRLIIVLALVNLALFYASTTLRALTPRVDRTYRDLFLTPILSINPRAPRFGADGGLMVRPGAWIDLTRDRRHLARFDWDAFPGRAPILAGDSGRLLVRPPIGAAAPEAFRLTMELRCDVAGAPLTLEVAVAGQDVGNAVCGPTASRTALTIPAGLIGSGDHEVIRIGVMPGEEGAVRRWRRALRIDLVEILGFSLEPVSLLGRATPPIDTAPPFSESVIRPGDFTGSEMPLHINCSSMIFSRKRHPLSRLML